MIELIWLADHVEGGLEAAASDPSRRASDRQTRTNKRVPAIMVDHVVQCAWSCEKREIGFESPRACVCVSSRVRVS